jgi:hypothetical protein
MALGKIKADQIEHSTAGSLDTQYVVNGSAKAWLNLNGSTFGTRDSFNNSSATDVSTGKYDLAFTSNMSDGNFSLCTNGSRANDETITNRINNNTASGYRIQCFESDTPSTAFQDSDSVFTQIAGDLA